jgi:tRNA dimethylallyltransferase
MNPLVLGIEYERSVRRNRISERLKMRLENGLVEEVEDLLQKGISAEKMDYYGLEYRYVTRYIQKEYTYNEMFARLNTAIHQFAKRQMTYFRGFERRGLDIIWIENPDSGMVVEVVDRYDFLRFNKKSD